MVLKGYSFFRYCGQENRPETKLAIRQNRLVPVHELVQATCTSNQLIASAAARGGAYWQMILQNPFAYFLLWLVQLVAWVPTGINICRKGPMRRDNLLPNEHLCAFLWSNDTESVMLIVSPAGKNSPSDFSSYNEQQGLTRVWFYQKLLSVTGVWYNVTDKSKWRNCESK